MPVLIIRVKRDIVPSFSEQTLSDGIKIYILERWSKHVKRRHIHIKSSHDKPLLEPRSKRFNDLIFQLHNICEFA
ncbi:hypothetical protein Ahy_B09g098168 isoform B [Arachis hypogaea]|uniref:Uncharacterized protein n=1 Tax=Arachis hypogaea TaxID=3818 RepID=A0A444XQN7_ARAHY|nr:hypothetical protein Ahy_B09g098168 isoform B [Arachis hypogaea]